MDASHRYLHEAACHCRGLGTRRSVSSQQHLHIIILPRLPPRFALPSLRIGILANDDVQPRARARHTHAGHASVPVGFDVGEGGEDDDVVF